MYILIKFFKKLVGFFFKILFIYLREREHAHKQRGEAEAEGEADSLLSREPDIGLDLRTLGS